VDLRCSTRKFIPVNAWPYLIVVVLLGGMLALSLRNRRRQVAEEMVRVSRIGVGTEVMTTSGLYGTVVAKHDDSTVLLAIAPGVEVKWAAAALRDAPSLAEPYRRALDEDGDDADTDPRPADLDHAEDDHADGTVDLGKNADRKSES
jgi:preprotein translocase subunit YajC